MPPYTPHGTGSAAYHEETVAECRRTHNAQPHEVAVCNGSNGAGEHATLYVRGEYIHAETSWSHAAARASLLRWLQAQPDAARPVNPRACPGCRALDGEHTFGPACTLTDPVNHDPDPDA